MTETQINAVDTHLIIPPDPRLVAAVRALAGICDYAQMQDGVGYNKSDTVYGHWLGHIDPADWDNGHALAAWIMLRKYKKQLAKIFEINYDEIPKPEGEIESRKREKRSERESREKAIAERMTFKTAMMDISDLFALNWSEPKIVKDGTLQISTASLENLPNKNAFWNLWNAKKEEIRALGMRPEGPNQWHQGWVLNWWVKIGYEDKEEKEETLPKLLHPELLKPYQIGHTQNLVRAFKNNNAIVDGSDTGTGKTYTAIEAIETLNLRMLVICPKAIIPGWLRAIKYFNAESRSIAIVNYELIKIGKMITYVPRKKGTGMKAVKVPCPYISVTPNPLYNKEKYASKWLIKWNLPNNNDVIIFDEAHRLKNKNTINTQLSIAAKDQNLKIMLLSATLGENPLKMIAIGYILGFYKKLHYFYHWAENYGCSKELVDKWNDKYAWVFDGHPEHIQALHNLIYPKLGSRMKISEIPDFPETQIIAETYQIEDTEKLNKIYEQLQPLVNEIRNIIDTLDEHDDRLSLRQKLRQEAEILKVPTMVDLAEDLLDQGYSVALFVNYTATLHALCDHLKTNCTLYGENSGDVNERNRKAFHEDKERVIVCNIQAAKEGIDLHDINGTYPRATLISPTDSAEWLIQVLGRVRRSGGKSKSIQRIIYAANTVEEDVCNNVRAKIDNINTLNDGDLGKNAIF